MRNQEEHLKHEYEKFGYSDSHVTQLFCDYIFQTPLTFTMVKSPRNQQTAPDLESSVLTPQRRTSSYADISPAETFDTALTSPTSFDEPSRLPPQKILFEHNVKTSSRNRSAGLLLGMRKPALALVTLMVLGTGGAAALGWFQIPGLNGQIRELEAQVKLLSGEIDRLASENDRYANLNGELNRTVNEFRDMNEDLSATVFELEEISDELNTTNLELVERVDDLAAENRNYAELNQELNITATRLGREVGFFEAAIEQLILENGALSNLTESIQGVAEQLGDLTADQNETLTELYGVLNGLTTENNRLESLNSDLVSIVTFLNETSLGLGNSLDQVAGFLSAQIVANQVLVSESLENTYRQRVQNWDCDYRDHFRGQPFGNDYDVTIGDLIPVINYANERVLSELCLDSSDFELYLMRQYPEGVSSFRFISALTIYTAEALDFYFPEQEEQGISPEEWANASYKCQNLQTKFSLSASKR